MNNPLIETLFGYGAWRNAVLLRAASGLSEAELFAPNRFPAGSLGGTFIHALGADRLWLARLTGAPTGPFAQRDEFPTFDAIVSGWKPIEAALTRYALGCSEADLARRFDFRRLNGEAMTAIVGETLIHIANHGMQHGAEIAQMLTELGRSPGDIDLFRYTRERDARTARSG